MWRWIGPIVLTAIACALYVHSERPGGYMSGPSAPVLWIIAMVIASPTILVYRLLIWSGERLTPKRPISGAIACVFAFAVLPPFGYNLLVRKDLREVSIADAQLGGLDTLAITDRDYGDDRGNGVALCNSDCQRFLFSETAKRVLVNAPVDIEQHEDELRYVLKIQRRVVCPPVGQGDRENGVSLVFSGPESARMLIMERTIALIATGRCITRETAKLRDANLLIGRAFYRRGDGFSVISHSGSPMSSALLFGEYQLVKKKAHGVWQTIIRRPEYLYGRQWTIPFSLLPSGKSLFATMDFQYPSDATSESYAQISYPDAQIPADIGAERVRALLREAIEMPATEPRDARHQLAAQYLRTLTGRQADQIDREILKRLAVDPRIAAEDLKLLPVIVSGTGKISNGSDQVVTGVNPYGHSGILPLLLNLGWSFLVTSAMLVAIGVPMILVARNRGRRGRRHDAITAP